jgi:formylglycine-generating enzyme required for sulfatase activity
METGAMLTLLWMSYDGEKGLDHLRSVCKGHGIALWSFRDILGVPTKMGIRDLIERASIILLPISLSFLNDPNARDGLDLAIKRHRAGDAMAVRVMVEHCTPGPELDAQLGSLLTIPSNGRRLAPDKWHILGGEMHLIISGWNARKPRGVPQHSTRTTSSTEDDPEQTMSLEQHRTLQQPRPRRTAALSEGRTLAGRYKLVARIDITSMTAIWRAIDKNDGRILTVHVLHPDIPASGRQRVVGYMDAMAKLAHPAITPVIEHNGRDGQHFFFVNEVFEGKTLKSEALRRSFEVDEVVSLIWHIGGALALAHQAGLSHGDVRPANVLTDGQSLPRLSDFKPLWDARSIRPLEPGAFEAHLYAAPELYEPSAEPTPQSDVYGLAMTALFCLLGSELPDEVSGAAPLESASTATPRLIDELPCAGAIQNVLRRALRRSPSERYEDAGAFRAALVAAYQESKPASLEMVSLPGGAFLMGDDDSPFKHDKPVHGVEVSPFEMSKHEVTQRRYRQVMLSNPSYQQGDELPVTRVTFFDAIEFCNRLSALEGRKPAYKLDGGQWRWDRSSDGYRLPTEAEWEYAARGTSGRVYPWASDEDPAAQLCWSGSGNDHGAAMHRAPTAVGSYPGGRTPEGLMDMAGNVWEWCWDWYKPYEAGDLVDPEGPPVPFTEDGRPPLRVCRGAAWNVRDTALIRASTRSKEIPTARDPDIGFRVVRGAPRTI